MTAVDAGRWVKARQNGVETPWIRVDAWTAELELELELRWTGAEHVRGPGIPQAHLICSRDRQSVFCLSADTRHGSIVFKADELQAAVIRHARQVHDSEAAT